MPFAHRNSHGSPTEEQDPRQQDEQHYQRSIDVEERGAATELERWRSQPLPDESHHSHWRYWRLEALKQGCTDELRPSSGNSRSNCRSQPAQNLNIEHERDQVIQANAEAPRHRESEIAQAPARQEERVRRRQVEQAEGAHREGYWFEDIALENGEVGGGGPGQLGREVDELIQRTIEGQPCDVRIHAGAKRLTLRWRHWTWEAQAEGSKWWSNCDQKDWLLLNHAWRATHWSDFSSSSSAEACDTGQECSVCLQESGATALPERRPPVECWSHVESSKPNQPWFFKITFKIKFIQKQFELLREPRASLWRQTQASDGREESQKDKEAVQGEEAGAKK